MLKLTFSILIFSTSFEHSWHKEWPRLLWASDCIRHLIKIHMIPQCSYLVEMTTASSITAVRLDRKSISKKAETNENKIWDWGRDESCLSVLYSVTFNTRIYLTKTCSRVATACSFRQEGPPGRHVVWPGSDGLTTTTSNPTGLTLGPGSASRQCIVGTTLPF